MQIRWFRTPLGAAFGAGLVAIGAVSIARAEDRTVNITGGKRTLIYSYAMYDGEQCTSGQIPQGRVVNAPRGGRIEFAEERRSINAGRCGTIQGWAQNVYFTPARGFRGADSARVDFEYNKWTDAPALTADSVTFTFNIR